MGRGGFRANAGRPVGSGKHGEPTVRVRVPQSLAPRLDKVQAIFALISDYELRSSQASATSPRWEQLRLFLSDIRSIENEGEGMSETRKVYYMGLEVEVLGQSEDGSKSVIKYLSGGRTCEVKTSELIKGK
jgi:hypothetical protein